MSLKVRRRLVQLKELLTESDELKRVQSQVEQLKAEQDKWRFEQQRNETELETLATKIEESNDMLMGGSIHNPKELESLQANIESLQRQRSTAETNSVEALYKSEELATQLSNAESKLAEMQESWNTNQTQLTEEDTKLKRAYLVLKKQREQVAERISEPLLQRYEQMRQRKGGVAVATVENDTCSACHVQLPTGVLSTVIDQGKTDKQILCPTCGRLLFVP
ncbi:MAG TPA: C4-type zinc ribbon domain-containing protein [Caldilineaceae bacterium]|nr:C4-type zinc ribbon domain-containing protein [Caldilineaceae bacterium]